jgi:hypothetical protein
MAAAFEIEFPDFTFALSQTIPVAPAGCNLAFPSSDFRQIRTRLKGTFGSSFFEGPTKKEPVF